jgi:probable F420-dependent oxidoreductase
MELGRTGIWTGCFDLLSPAELADTAAELEEMGWGTLWFSEAVGREIVSQGQLLLAATRRMTIASGIANIWARDAMSCNAAVRTLASTHPGRFVLGLGVSHKPLVERGRGGVYHRPLAAMRAYLTAMDTAPYLAYDAAAPRPARVLAALGPAMLEVAREQADGAHPYLVTPEHTAIARGILGPDKVIATEISAVISDDLDVWLQRAHTHLELYTGLPNYVNSWKRLGFTDDDAVRGGSPRLKEALVCRGLEATVAKVAEHLAAGADHVCVQVLGESPLAVPRADWHRLSEALHQAPRTT